MPEDGLSRLEDARALVRALLLLGVGDLCRLSLADRHRHRLDRELADGVWFHLCEVCWRSKSPRYQLTPERLRFLSTAEKHIAWREHYRRAALEGRRAALRPEELHTLRWAFNFTPTAGGRGSSTLQFVEFRAQEPGAPKGVLLLAGYPLLPYELSADGKVLYIANFPPHTIRRLDSWEWEIVNENVTFVSCFGAQQCPRAQGQDFDTPGVCGADSLVDEGDDPQYNERGFLQLSEESLAKLEEDLLQLPGPAVMGRLLRHLEDELPAPAAVPAARRAAVDLAEP